MQPQHWPWEKSDLDRLPPDDDLFRPGPSGAGAPSWTPAVEDPPRARVLSMTLALVLVVGASGLGWAGAKATTSHRHASASVASAGVAPAVDAVPAGPPPADSTGSTLPPAETSTAPVAIAPVSAAPTCQQAVAMNDHSALLSAFRAARIRGRGTEGCATKAALAAYCDLWCDAASFSGSLAPSPGPICLYHCWHYRVAAIADQALEGEIDAAGSVAYTWTVTLVSSDGTATESIESLLIGPGRPVGGATDVGQVIIGAATSG